MTMVLDVLTPLSDCRQESVEKMERTISGVSYMCWIDFHNGILGCGFFCARLISVCLFFWVSITARATTPHRSLFRLPRRGLPRPYGCIQANRLPRLQGYHTRATTLQINSWVQSGYHTYGQILAIFPFIEYQVRQRVLLQQQLFHRAWRTPHGPTQHASGSSNNSEASVWTVARPCVGTGTIRGSGTIPQNLLPDARREPHPRHVPLHCPTQGVRDALPRICLLYTSPSPRDS